MKKIFLTLVLIALSCMFVFSAACSFNVELDGCFSEQSQEKEESIPEGDIEEGEIDAVLPEPYLNMALVEWRSFFIPRVEAKVIFSQAPKKLNLVIENSTFELMPISCTIIEGNYVFYIKQDACFRDFDKGEYTVRVQAVFENGLEESDCTFNLNVGEDLELINGPSNTWVLDKTSNWTENM